MGKITRTRVCQEHGCPEICYAPHNRCEAHEREFNRSTRQRRRSEGTARTLSGSEVQELRKKILREQGGVCAICGRAFGPWILDHITPKSWGGSDDRSNLQVIDEDCSKKKSAQETRPHVNAPAQPQGEPGYVTRMRTRREQIAPLVAAGLDDGQISAETGIQLMVVRHLRGQIEKESQ